MANTPVQDTIPKLFKGLMRSYVRCIDVSFESSRDEYFYDVQLNVKGKPNSKKAFIYIHIQLCLVIESFRDYTEPETLEGENMYDAGDLGMQKAEKGVKVLFDTLDIYLINLSVCVLSSRPSSSVDAVSI